jgi:hypothetical protein
LAGNAEIANWRRHVCLWHKADNRGTATICPLLDKSEQSSALARDASVATIELFWKEKFVSTALVPAASRCGTECGIASICSTGSPLKTTGYAQKVAEGEQLETNLLQGKPA